MRPGHRPPRDKRYFHTQKKFNGSGRVRLTARLDALGKAQRRHDVKLQVRAARGKKRF